MTTEAAASSQQDSAQALSDDAAFSAGFEYAADQSHTFQEPARAESQDDSAGEPASEEVQAGESLEEKIQRLESLLGQTNHALELASNRLRSVEGRTGQLSGDFRQIRSKFEQAPAAAPVQQATAMDKIREEYPEIGAAIEEAVGSVRPKTAPTQTEMTQTSAPQVDPVMQERYGMVEEFHPGWQQTIVTPEFRSYVQSLGVYGQQMAESDRVKDAVRLLDEYKAAHSQSAAPAPQNTQTIQAQAPNRNRLRQAAQTGTRATGATNALSDDDAFLEGFKSARG